MRGVYTIAAGEPFLDQLAEGVLRNMGADPLLLSKVHIFLPTRRACAALRESFLRLNNGLPLLLPKMTPLGDVDEDVVLTMSVIETVSLPPAMPVARRNLLLTNLILARGAGERPDQAARLAVELGRLQDQVDTAGLSFDRLSGLVPDEYAEHWQQTLKFLDILTVELVSLAQEQGCISAAARRNLLLRAQGQVWQASPPNYPVIAAGSTGSIPATADLLKIISRLPTGVVILPGLDQAMDDHTRAALSPSHPQFGMTKLINHLEVPPAIVQAWLGRPGVQRSNHGRFGLISEALRPATTIDEWRNHGAIDPAALAGLSLLECANPQEEAGAIAILLREVLETPSKTAALVTPDRQLARRVAAELARWGVSVYDSAGTPLMSTSIGTYLQLIAVAAQSNFAPVPLLAALKHPFSAGGMNKQSFDNLVAALECAVLRGPRPAPGFAGLKAALIAKGDEKYDPQLVSFLDRLEEMSSTFTTHLSERVIPLDALLRAHIDFAEALASTDVVAGAQRLWAGEDGELMARVISDLAENALWMAPLPGADYPALMEVLCDGEVVHFAGDRHPRLAIWGPLEARLQQPDLFILGSLNEGSWPAEAATDPWMSKAMRESFGLASLDRQTGQAAHDFVQACCAREVVLTRSMRQDGAPTVRSRWLQRLITLLGDQALLSRRDDVLAWQAAIDAPMAPARPAAAPRPCPPLAARPRKLSVTQIELWMRDPFALYAKHILKLQPLDPIDADPAAADYGTLTHKALELFVKKFASGFPADPLGELLQIGRVVFRDIEPQPGLWAFWWPRFEQVARWFVSAEQARRSDIAWSQTEVAGSILLPAPGGEFTLTAKVDRIDFFHIGGAAIIDYKTGKPPSWTAVEKGFAPQLSLEAAMLSKGAFPTIAALPAAALEYWHLKGGREGGKISTSKTNADALADQALAGLLALVAKFDDPLTAYACQPSPTWAPKYREYDHLARVREWSVAAGDIE